MDLSNKYMTIQGWMVSELGLKGNDLLVYAIIYGFSQNGESEFTGSLSYLADWCKASKNGIQKNLKNLIDRGLIVKREIYKNNIKLCAYSCTGYTTQLDGGIQHSCTVYNSVVRGIQHSCTGYTTQLDGGIQLSCINNIDNNIDNIIDSNIDREILKNEEFSKSDSAKKEIIKKKEKSKKLTKKENTLKMVETKCLEYDIEDDAVIEQLQEFYGTLLDAGKMVTKQKIEADLLRIAKVSDNKKKETIKIALERGWQTLNPEWLNNATNNFNSSRRNAHLTCGNTHESYEERKAYHEQLTRMKEEGKLNDF